MSGSLVPLSQFVLKVHSRCDLACDHCYVYEAADQSWHGRPMVISDEVAAQTAQRIAEHARTHALRTVQVVLHGGEPLLAGRVRLERIIKTLRIALDGVCPLDMRIHTNGVLLSEAFCEMFARNEVKVGISLDGDRVANDRHRRYADGRSSYDKVIAAIGLLRTPRFRQLYAGLLCTIDIANDPLAVYDSLLELMPPRIDFLLPHATWDTPPTREAADGTDYADWLIAIYDRWAAQGRPVQIRTFDSILSTLAGGRSFTEALGLEPATLAVVETDGSYEQVDSLKAAFDGAPDTGTNVFDHDLDAVARHPGIQARQQGITGLSTACQRCPVVTSCGGGLYTHRYRTGNGFDNPSVFCADLLKLITHIGSRPPSAIPAHALAAADLELLGTGSGGAAVMTQLADAQQSLLRAMLGSVYQAANTGAAATDGGDLDAAWSLLTTLDRTQPNALGPVLRHPYVRVWAMRCLEQLRSAASHPPAENPAGLASDLGHLGAIAAAAAIRARVQATVTVPVVDAAVHLPTIGRLIFTGPEHGHSAAGARQSATVAVHSDAVVIETCCGSRALKLRDQLTYEAGTAADGGERSEWQPLRLLRAPGLCVTLEDTDRYRDCHQWPAAPRLADSEFAQWQGLFEEAWQEIDRNHGSFAPGLAAGPITLTPLAGVPGDRDTSTAARHSPGAVAMSLPTDPVIMALLLICGLQQMKLNAVMDLYDLYDPADDRLFPAPWGEGKQHMEGLFQDAYTHLAGTNFWRVRQQLASGRSAQVAGQRFAQWRAESLEAIQTIADSGPLTPLGMKFLQSMSDSIGHS